MPRHLLHQPLHSRVYISVRVSSSQMKKIKMATKIQDGCQYPPFFVTLRLITFVLLNIEYWFWSPPTFGMYEYLDKNKINVIWSYLLRRRVILPRKCLHNCLNKSLNNTFHKKMANKLTKAPIYLIVVEIVIVELFLICNLHWCVHFNFVLTST